VSGTAENTRPSLFTSMVSASTMNEAAILRDLPVPTATTAYHAAEAVAARYAPAFIVVDQQGIELLRSSRLRNYVAAQPLTGAASVVALACDDLRGVLRHLMDQVMQTGCPVRANRVSYAMLQPDGSTVLGNVDLVVENLPGADQIILFFDVDDECIQLDVGGNVAQTAASWASALSTNQELVRLMASVVPAFLFTTAPNLSVHDINQPFYDYVGLTEEAFLAGGWNSVIHPDDRAENQRRWHVAALEGGVFEHEHRLRAADGTWRWFLSRSVPQLDAEGKLVRWFGSAVDIHQRRRDEMRQRRLLAEVQHRAKNILAVVRSLLSRTLESATGLDDFAAHLSGRISALARTQTALGRTVDGAVSLDELAHQEVLAQGGQVSDQVSIEGPCVMLTEKVAETLGLTLHELATNALKFGALSEPYGRVKIWWTIAPCENEADGTSHLTLNWEESGMALSKTLADHSGFGRELIERGLPYELDARTKLQFRPEGVLCNISVILKTPPQGGPLIGEAA